MRPAGRHFLQQGDIPPGGREKSTEFTKEITIQADVLLSLHRPAQESPGNCAGRHTGFLATLGRRKIPTVKEIPAQYPEIQRLIVPGLGHDQPYADQGRSEEQKPGHRSEPGGEHPVRPGDQQNHQAETGIEDHPA